MKEQFLTYEQALALKELGFDEPCLATHGYLDLYIGTDDGHVKAPLKSQFFKWVRDKKLTDASINRHGTHDGGYSYRWDIVYEYGVYEERHFKLGYKTYEEAEDACINEIIELLKLK